MKKLHILRHAKTNQYSNTGKDIDRELLAKGIKQSVIFGENKGCRINNVKILCSSSQRTKQTLELIKTYLNFSCIEYIDDLYLATCNEIESLINKQGNIDEDLLIIGHNFGLSDLASNALNKEIYLKTCEYVCLQIKIDNWNGYIEGCGKKIDSYRPKVN